MNVEQKIEQWQGMVADVAADEELHNYEEFWMAQSSGALVAEFGNVLAALLEAQDQLAVASIYGAKQRNNGRTGKPLQTFASWYAERQAVRP